jgi:serine/threonine-protein kinase RsbW/sigma-B regulation protein RsbU (phosphoserine phosphatase)
VAEDQLELKVANDLAALPRVAAELEAFCSRHGIPYRDVNRFNLALEEVLTNAISYGFPDGGRHEIDVSVRCRDGALQATVSDDGVAFDPLAQPTPDLGAPAERRAVGGLGIHLVRELTEAIDYRRAGGRNVLTFRLRIGGRQS